MARGKKKEKELTIEERLEKALVPIEEQPYSVPENWCWVRWGSCGNFIAGSGFKNEFQGFTEYSIPFYKVGSLKYSDFAGYLFDNTNTVNEEMRTALKATLIPENSILFAKIGEAIRLNRRSLNRVPCCIDNNMMAFVPDSYVFNFYAFFWSKGIELYDYTNATTVPAIRKSDLENIPFPLPPLAEQRRIVDRIESLFAKLDEAKEKAQTVADSFETRKAAILHKAFTGELTKYWCIEHGTDKKRWMTKNLGDITINHDSQRIPLSRKERNGLAHLFDYYGASGVIDRVDRFIFEGRFLLIGEDGANLVMRSKPIAFIAEGQFWVNNHAHVLSTASDISMDFLCYYINSIDLTSYITGSAQPKMTQAKMNSIPVPVPTIDEQVEIVHILDSLLTKEQQVKEAAKAVLDQIEVMKKSILARAFRGELGTNDPTEESSIELLKQIL